MPIPRPLWGYPDGVTGYEYNLDKAKDYLAKAKVKIDRPIDVLVQAPLEPTVQAALMLQSDLATLGIELRIVKSVFTSIVASTKTVESTPDMWIHWISTYYVDPENWIGEMYDSANGGTWKASSSTLYRRSSIPGRCKREIHQPKPASSRQRDRGVYP